VDLRSVQAADLRGFDCVVHLAELSNDPLGELRPDVTLAINHAASVRLASLAKQAGVSRFVYASSCAVYGLGRDGVLTEQSTPNPQTTYARCKVMVETDVGALADEGFSPVFLRNATAFGASPRMRFDIVLNNLAGLARTTGQIQMTSDGTPWRPLVHVLDICQAVACAVEAPRASIHNETFNVGDNAQNYQVRDIAALVQEAFPDCDLALGSNGGDRRSYRVSFDKIRTQLPGFRCEWDARKGVAQLRELFDRIELTRERFQFRAFTRLEELKYLLGTRQLDDHLFWRH
jgi:nucleoside-diphosphate-sugar epimerase